MMSANELFILLSSFRYCSTSSSRMLSTEIVETVYYCYVNKIYRYGSAHLYFDQSLKVTRRILKPLKIIKQIFLKLSCTYGSNSRRKDKQLFIE